MKKILALILVMAMGLSLMACGGKTEPTETDDPSEQPQTGEEDTPGSSDLDPIEGDPQEYGREYWEEKISRRKHLPV